ncbi:MAG: hypothetical protein ACRDHP_13735, partial [Ktedonobacterales bacterium]
SAAVRGGGKYFVAALIACALTGIFAPSIVFAAPTQQHQSATATGKPGTKHVGPNGQYCDPGGEYTGTSYVNERFTGVSPTYHDFNQTNHPIPFTFTSTATGTVSLSVSASVTLDANAILAGAQVTTGATLSISLTISSSNSATATAAPGQSVYGQYGVFEEISKGDYTYYYSNCTYHDYGIVNAYVPDGIGWYIHN